MKKPLAPSLLALAVLPAATSHGAVLFADTFDRTNTGVYNDNTTNGALDATLSGITDNTGAGFTAGNVYGRPYTSGGAGILDNELLLASGSGTSNAFIDHNFTNAGILSEGGFSVTIDVTGLNESGAGQGGGFAIGMTRPDALSSGDALNATSKFQDAFHGAANTDTSVSIASFFLVLRGNGRLVWGGSGNYVTNTNNGGIGLSNLPGFPNTGTISATFTNFTDFNAGTSFDYEVFYNGDSQGSGTLTWQTTNSNYIGIDARDNQGVTFDNLSITTVPEPSAALLGSFGLLGLLRRRR